MPKLEIKVILFDLGGVLVELDGPPFLPEWLKNPLAELENWQSWARCSAVERFESGELTPQAFAEQVIQEMDLEVTKEDFIARFKAWPKGLYEGAEALLAQLREHYTLACYSNTSEVHWPIMMEDMKLGHYLHYAWASYQIACYKPSVEGFNLILNSLRDELGVSGENVLFIDDNPLNVEAAVSCGMQGRQARGFQAVCSTFQELGIL